MIFFFLISKEGVLLIKEREAKTTKQAQGLKERDKSHQDPPSANQASQRQNTKLGRRKNRVEQDSTQQTPQNLTKEITL